MVRDPIGDMIIRIKNASASGKESLVLPYSSFKEAILGVLEKEGFIGSYSKKGKKVAKQLEVGLLYDQNGPRIHDVKQVSKLSKRLYEKSKDIKSVKYGFGIMVLTTPKGVLSDREAKKQNVGGEALFKIW